MRKYHGIRMGRRAVAVAVAAVITLCVATGARCVFTRMQIFPAIMAGSAVWLLLWAVVTMVFGRVYCSSVCPSGTLMDAVARLRMAVERAGHRRYRLRYRYASPSVRGRYSVLFVVVLCAVLGFSVMPALLDPYSAYARMVAAVRSLVAIPAGRAAGIGVVSAAVAVGTLVVISAASWRRGRYLCNTICPVGSALSLISRHSIYHADINTDLCMHCMRCVDTCKASCINPADMTVDTSRCVVCFDCMDVCPNDAITYRRGRHALATPLMQPTAAGAPAASMEATSPQPVRLDRRQFLKTGVVAAAAGVGAAMRAAVTPVPAVWNPVPLYPLNAPVPPGFGSRSSFLRRCTACGACVAACPTGVIRPAVREYGLRHAMLPVMDYGSVACRTDCNACTQVCPSGALVPLTLSEKRRFVIGKARVRLQNCLAYGRDKSCGRCARRCPLGAITMIRLDDGRRGPVVDLQACIGCGACMAACPSHPYKAIVIEGVE
ncbi:MAG: 4Fe-4S binding protein [Muribaculaceae bacterium]|nr:4Fe-4S binding protein [Muribaculaceae bacterium]